MLFSAKIPCRVGCGASCLIFSFFGEMKMCEMRSPLKANSKTAAAHTHPRAFIALKQMEVRSKLFISTAEYKEEGESNSQRIPL